ncbi:MAG: hypothetical protein KBA31_19020 [Alphaproteobacteria bacterium]|nr:hypothetical protein [Alphaproteobacteria bacterium]
MTEELQTDETDLLQEIHKSGWVDSCEHLSDAQKKQLRGVIGDRLASERAQEFSALINLAFGRAVRGERSLRAGEQRKLTTVARGEVEAVMNDAEALLEKLTILGPAGQAALEVAFEANLPESGVLNPGMKFRNVRNRLTVELENFIALGDGRQIAVQRGKSEPALRQMVRELAGLVEGFTGKLPTRVYRVPETSKSGEGEDGLLLRLSKLMADFVDAALPIELRRLKRATLTGIVREEIERLRAMEEKTANSINTDH